MWILSLVQRLCLWTVVDVAVGLCVTDAAVVTVTHQQCAHVRRRRSAMVELGVAGNEATVEYDFDFNT